ncbi:Poly(A) polymerase central domain-containing protein [Mycena maculata]|uniref:Poly(A) polymerase n=1 Tax=Mycena maculata TaxID=230809 RepID=A0AAD7IY86_9AGAR|nr:Poly(A) polymerase central domain-containing protein [Mycena maculata]
MAKDDSHGCVRFLGVTPPIATSESNERERGVTITLVDELRRQDAFESDEEARRREIVLGHVASLVKSFVRTVGISRGLSQAAATAAGGKIFTSRLGVGSDLNTLCVLPRHVSRDDFFEVFEPMLMELEGVSEVTGVPDAYVPIIRVRISEISKHFAMAQLARSSIPDDLSLRDDALLLNLDERCVRSLRDYRVTDEILRLVPNMQVFRDSLRCVILWAQRRAIYSHVNGFLGGVSWAILVARICQLYPNAIAGAIISRFFIIMYRWSWSQPVLLKQVEEGPPQSKLPVWNPMLYPADRSHRMPITTPAFPAMSSTHNVTASTQMIMTQEFKKAANIVDKVIVGKVTWSELFAKHDFFRKYRYYLPVIAWTGNAELQRQWAGRVQSRIPQLVMKLEYVDSVTLAHPFVKGFDQTLYCLTDEVARLAQGEISNAVLRKKEDIEGKEGGGVVHLTTFYVGLLIAPKQAGAVGPRRLDLSYPIQEFTNLVKAWEKFDESSMSICVQNIKSSALPDYVYDAGERPQVGRHRSIGK